MTTAGAISAFYQEFTEALTEVLAENSVGPARRGRLARARAAVKKHPNYAEHEYFLGRRKRHARQEPYFSLMIVTCRRRAGAWITKFRVTPS